MSLIGNIEPFNPDQADITTYIERIEQLFICNDVNEKKVPLFLTLLGGEAYNVLKDLLSPQLPSQKTYAALKETLINHYNLKRLVIAERYKFYSANQDSSEDIKSYQIKLKNLSKYCKFEGFLDEALRDKFVFGLFSEQIKQRLLTEDDLTFEKACEIATKMEFTENQILIISRNDEENIVNQLDNDKSDDKLNEESSQNKSNEYLTQANQESNSKTMPIRQMCKRYTKVNKDYSAMNSKCVSCNQMDHTSSKFTSRNRACNTENQEDKQNEEENNHILELKFIDIDTIDSLEETRKKADPNYATCDENRRHEKRVIHEKQFDDTYDTYDDSIDEDCDSASQLQTSYKKIKINENWESSGKKSLHDKQLLHKKQFSCNKISQIATLSTSKHSLYDKSQTQIVDPLQIVQMDESSEFGPQEMNVQNLEFISTTAPSVTVSDIEKLIPICEETLRYVKSIDRRLRVLEKGVINEEEPEGMNVFDDLLPINSIQNLKRFEESIETAEIKTKFMEFIKRIGGKGNKNMIQRCMSRLFTNEFGISCSWCGRGNNYRMCDLKCIQVLKIVLRARGINECEFETIASEWFRLSKLRYDRENKKVLPTDDCDTQEKET
ncbi:PREDICTED: uncharacterized protein LOC105152048 isoform X2 [Acromyrmex echinatior]|uniref:uncharacterized protein LOC105152048 isoform X2 n=1 Tax=Acromyrmex echinatior TaxID=103372 RepID=UPI000580BA05|nr:PREDICTED: uncharacterized protein LOC105152048 isoform X2 [Acromyrmex echinatior]